ncbi:SRPBCC domain-containing protein [Modestobacter sp. NPDC049651]|uniref:SRPBCC family protein n=1 Tax=unclassified Modestobacter TaxID=2643866 RepID=UPI0034020601
MQLENSFTVPVPVEEAWRVLMDIERIAPCMPGAALDSVSGDDFTGRVKVKLGPINLTYQGKASFVERDETAHRAVIDAKGKDQRGNGTAAATVTATLAAEGSITRVDVLTDLNITGRPAQFGRGVMTDVGNKLLGQFADRLSAQLASGEGETVDAEAAAQSQEPTVAKAAAATGAKAAATVAGVAEEAAASTEGTPAKKAGAAVKKAAGAAADKAADAEESAAGAPAKKAAAAKATPAKKTAPAKAAPVPDPTAPPARSSARVEEVAPAAEVAPTAGAAEPAAPTPISAVRKAPSQPPTGNTAPPNRPAAGGPAKSTPAAAPRPVPAEPEPIDLLEVAGSAALVRYAKPAAGAAVGLLVLTLLIRRLRKH